MLYKVKDGTVTLVYTLEDICVSYPYDWEYEGTDLQEVMEQGATKPMLQTQAPEALYLSIVPSGIKAEILLGL